MELVVVLVSLLDHQVTVKLVLFTMSVLLNDEEFCVKEQGDENIKIHNNL